MDVINTSHKILIALICCFTISMPLVPSLSFANNHDERAAEAVFADENHVTPTLITDDQPESNNEDDYDMGFLEGCTGGAVAGSVFPGIGTIIGGLLGCGVAWLW